MTTETLPSDEALDSPAEIDESAPDPLPYPQALAWAGQYLPTESAAAYVDWLWEAWADMVAGEDLTCRQLLTDTLWTWRGRDFPDPPPVE